MYLEDQKILIVIGKISIKDFVATIKKVKIDLHLSFSIPKTVINKLWSKPPRNIPSVSH